MIDRTTCSIVSESEHTDVVSTAAVDRVKLEETKPLLPGRGFVSQDGGKGGGQVGKPFAGSV